MRGVYYRQTIVQLALTMAGWIQSQIFHSSLCSYCLIKLPINALCTAQILQKANRARVIRLQVHLQAMESVNKNGKNGVVSLECTLSSAYDCMCCCCVCRIRVWRLFRDCFLFRLSTLSRPVIKIIPGKGAIHITRHRWIGAINSL